MPFLQIVERRRKASRPEVMAGAKGREPEITRSVLGQLVRMSGKLDQGQTLTLADLHTPILWFPYIPVMLCPWAETLPSRNWVIISQTYKLELAQGGPGCCQLRGLLACPLGESVYLTFSKAGSAYDQFHKRSPAKNTQDPISHICSWRVPLSLA